MGDTGFEPVTSSVSGQTLCLGMPANVASGASAGVAYVCHCAGWLADSLADNMQVASDGCKPQLANRRRMPHHGAASVLISLNG